MAELYLGVMSGTSLDGIDMALVEIGVPFRLEVMCYRQSAFAKTVRDELLTLMNGAAIGWPQLVALEQSLALLFTDEIEAFLHEVDLAPGAITAIGFHGLTLHHLPDGIEILGRHGRGSLQCGDPNVLGQRTGIKVVFDFRRADMALGGQGAPLAPFLDHLLFRHPSQGRVLVNLGGIANLTFLPPQGRSLFAFDSGPANMIIDGLMNRHPRNPGPYDPEGRYAASGKVIQALLDACLEHPYFSKKPPKSTGREAFGEDFLRPFLAYAEQHAFEDLLATATQLTATTLADAVRGFDHAALSLPPMTQMILSGGGAHNLTLVDMLRKELPRMSIQGSGHFGLDEDAKEATLMAALAWAHVHRIPANFPTVTGAERAVVLGASTA